VPNHLATRAQINVVPPLAVEIEIDASEELDVKPSEEVELPTAVKA
jgi:hypothetical protein